MRKNVLKELVLANKKLVSHNVISDIVFKGDWIRFFINCYLYCNSQSYGNKWTDKLLYHFKYLYPIPASLGYGDFFLRTKKTKENIVFENKLSISVNKKFNVKNIRPYQHFDFLLITFVDALDNFNTEYYCIPLYSFVKEFNLTYQNGTKKSNEGNTQVGLSKTFVKGSDDYNRLIKLSMMRNNTKTSLEIFLDDFYNER